MSEKQSIIKLLSAKGKGDKQWQKQEKAKQEALTQAFSKYTEIKIEYHESTEEGSNGAN